ncbi:3-phosphoshikimate 1-carboxyvinyltransferase (EC [Olavius sp. associated proteobacterium Delta 1]|nr:3-phosphoshikimate 1-carboxyvinyltransferase (EC [Olavius sp. associated proteobacterium Delta 1]
MKEIKPHIIKPRCEVTVPGSKSYTHRILIASALSDGECRIRNPLISEDTLLTLQALRQMGIHIADTSADQLIVSGNSGIFKPCADRIFLGNSGTSMRLLAAVAALGPGKFTLTGTDRMAERPIQDLIDALEQLGVRIRSKNHNGCPPLEIFGEKISGGSVNINCRTSSQYLSALLLIAPYTDRGLEILVTEGPVSRPYVDMTVDVMDKFGVTVCREGYERFKVAGKQTYRAGAYAVEPDGSQAGYFWAAAAVCGTEIKVKGVTADSRQGDLKFANLLATMGCEITSEPDGITVSGSFLKAADVDMGDMPDMVPTLAVVAVFAEGTTIIRNVSHLKTKESDRLAAVVNELVKMGIDARCSTDELIVTGGKPLGAEIETYGDHRIAMSFAVAGLVTPGMFIQDENCVVKSFPDFWHVFEGLYG